MSGWLRAVLLAAMLMVGTWALLVLLAHRLTARRPSRHRARLCDDHPAATPRSAGAASGQSRGWHTDRRHVFRDSPERGGVIDVGGGNRRGQGQPAAKPSRSTSGRRSARDRQRRARAPRRWAPRVGLNHSGLCTPGVPRSTTPRDQGRPRRKAEPSAPARPGPASRATSCSGDEVARLPQPKA